jgi:hypothetical protein
MAGDPLGRGMWRGRKQPMMGTARLIRPMFGSFPQSPYMPCAECGASVEREGAGVHECDTERLLDFRLFQLREEILAFDAQLAEWLASAHGRFAAWIAERDRRASQGRPPA